MNKVFQAKYLKLNRLHEKYGAGRNYHFQIETAIYDSFGMTRNPSNLHIYYLTATWSFFHSTVLQYNSQCMHVFQRHLNKFRQTISLYLHKRFNCWTLTCQRTNRRVQATNIFKYFKRNCNEMINYCYDHEFCSCMLCEWEINCLMWSDSRLYT